MKIIIAAGGSISHFSFPLWDFHSHSNKSRIITKLKCCMPLTPSIIMNYSLLVISCHVHSRKQKIKTELLLPPMILLLFLDLDWIFANLPMKSLGSNMSNDREAIRSRTIPSWLWLLLSRSWSWSWSWLWIREWPLQSFEVILSATGLLVLLISSRDMSPLSAHSYKSEPSPRQV